jgi:hypothetical protein
MNEWMIVLTKREEEEDEDEEEVWGSGMYEWMNEWISSRGETGENGDQDFLRERERERESERERERDCLID